VICEIAVILSSAKDLALRAFLPSALARQDAEKAVRRVVAAGLPRQISVAFNARWRGKPAATTFFSILLGFATGRFLLTMSIRYIIK
jgi:hypothetical protein